MSITTGLNVSRTQQIFPTPLLVSNADMRNTLGILEANTIHEERFSRILPAVQSLFETMTGICIFRQRVDVSFEEMYDWEYLPFNPVVPIKSIDSWYATSTTNITLFANAPQEISLVATGTIGNVGDLVKISFNTVYAIGEVISIIGSTVKISTTYTPVGGSGAFWFIQQFFPVSNSETTTSVQGIAFELTDFDGNVIDSETYKFIKRNGKTLLQGNFENGVKFIYYAGLYNSISGNGLYVGNETIKHIILSASIDVFEEKGTLLESVRKHLEGFEYVGN